jgi:hypothetical protein
MEFYRQLAAQTLPAFNATGNTGDKLELSLLPIDLDGGAVYVRELQLRINGQIQASAAGGMNYSNIISSVLLDIPGVSTLVNSVSGNKLARMFRLENGGEYPPYSGSNPWSTTSANVAMVQQVDMTWPIQFARSNSRRYDDFAVPAALLSKAKFRVSFSKLTDLYANITGSTLTLTVTAVCCRKREKRLGCLSIIDAQDIGAATEPVIQPFDGKVLSFLVQPQNDGTFPALTDWTACGIGFGPAKVTEDNTSVGVFYDRFNAISTTDFDKHTSTGTNPTSSIPVEFPPGGKQGQHTSFEAIPAGYKPRFKVDAAANSYAITYRKILDQRSPEAQNARRALGIASPRPMTASKKPTADANVAAYVPVKDNG